MRDGVARRGARAAAARTEKLANTMRIMFLRPMPEPTEGTKMMMHTRKPMAASTAVARTRRHTR
jgi:hypothetical protein